MSELPPVGPTLTPTSRWYRRRWVQVAVAIFVLLIVVAALTPSDDAGDRASTTSEAETVPAPTVELTLSSPSDGQTVRRGKVTLVGTTTPGAAVTVDGQAVKVAADGAWRRPVSLELGANDFDIQASAPGKTPESASVSVRRVRSAAERRAFELAQARKRAERAARERVRKAAAKQNFKNAAKSISYKQLIKDADAYKGTKAVFRGKILQIQQDGDFGGIMLLSVTDLGYDIWDDNVWIDYGKAIGAAEDDIITVYGTITGSKSYETQAGGETYVPRMRARYFE